MPLQPPLDAVASFGEGIFSLFGLFCPLTYYFVLPINLLTKGASANKATPAIKA